MLDKITGKAVQGQRYYNLQYNVCLEKGSDDIGSAVCDTIYTVYLSLSKQLIRYHANPFRGTHFI